MERALYLLPAVYLISFIFTFSSNKYKEIEYLEYRDDSTITHESRYGIEDTNIVFTADDVKIFNRLVNEYQDNKTDIPDKDIILWVANHFKNKEYTSCTLESDLENKLIVNLREFDCVTFVESVMAISICLKDGKNTFSDYARILQNLRYRKGIMNFFPSRLHYFTDWILNAQEQGFVNDYTLQIDSIPYTKEINYMTSHSDKYPKLQNNESFVEKMKKIEESLSSKIFYYLPKDKISDYSQFIENGDILVVTTNIKGLDVAHVGFAVKKDGDLYFLHASSQKKMVVLTEWPIQEYMQPKSFQTGLMVIRPK
ncbi:MAG: DUF1460 domain-containing protein [Marinilabiliales bacterium]|nr:MAG: DUF1460 domain-containing protein [Marinilabiliales bacterium]